MWQRSGWWWRAFWWWVRPEAGPRGLEVGDCQVMEILCYLKLTELLCVLYGCGSVLGVFLYLEFPFLPLIWREVPYPPRPCSSATRSLKLFLFSFPAGINSPIFSAPQNFTPILLQHSHCLPGRFGCLSAFPTWLWPLWAGDLYLTHFRFSLADAAHSPSYFLKGAECLTS